jgi:dolichol kinase
MRLDHELLSTEAERKLFHIAWAIMPLLYYLGYPRDGMLILLFLAVVFWTGFEIARRLGYPVISPTQMREHEKQGMLMGTFFQIISLFMAVLFFDQTIAILAMLFNCIGDAVTSYAGALLLGYLGKEKTAIRSFQIKLSPLRFGSIQDDLLHAISHRKSSALMAVMFITCIVMSFAIYPGISPTIIAAGAAGAVLADAFAWRLLGFTLDDDLTITLLAGAAMTAVSIL